MTTGIPVSLLLKTKQNHRVKRTLHILHCLLSLAFAGVASGQTAAPVVAWKFKTNGPLIASPVTDERAVYVGSLDSNFYALDLETARVLWRFEAHSPIRATACLDAGRVFVYCGDGALYALDKSTGNQIWRFKTFSGYMGERKVDFADYYHSSPVLHEGVLYFGGGDGHVYAVKSADGSLLWSFKTGDVVHSTPALKDNKLFIGSFDGHLYALNRLDGSLIWKFKSTGHRYFPKGEMMGSPAVAGKLVYVGARDYNFYAVDINGGYCHWMKQFPKGWALPVTVNDSVLYLGTSDDRQLLALDVKTGDTRWKAEAGYNIFGRCAIAGATGYFGTLMGKLHHIDLNTGKLLWTFETDAYQANRLQYLKPTDEYRDNIGALIGNSDDMIGMYYRFGAIFSTPALSGQLLFVSSSDGQLYCLRLK